jgi:hypothetical protein
MTSAAPYSATFSDARCGAIDPMHPYVGGAGPDGVSVGARSSSFDARVRARTRRIGKVRVSARLELVDVVEAVACAVDVLRGHGVQRGLQRGRVELHEPARLHIYGKWLVCRAFAAGVAVGVADAAIGRSSQGQVLLDGRRKVGGRKSKTRHH